MFQSVVLLIDNNISTEINTVEVQDCEKWDFTVTLSSQPSTWMDAFLYSKNILYRRKGLELLSLHNNRSVQALNFQQMFRLLTCLLPPVNLVII